MSGKIKIRGISLHLYLEFNENTSKMTLRFSPRQSGNRSIYLTGIDEKFLRYQHWEEILSTLPEPVNPSLFALRLIKKAYQDLPFLKDVEKVIIHVSGLPLYHIAESVETLSMQEPEFRNIRVR